jgi:hypothetical protein
MRDWLEGLLLGSGISRTADSTADGMSVGFDTESDFIGDLGRFVTDACEKLERERKWPKERCDLGLGVWC